MFDQTRQISLFATGILDFASDLSQRSGAEPVVRIGPGKVRFARVLPVDTGCGERHSEPDQPFSDRAAKVIEKPILQI